MIDRCGAPAPDRWTIPVDTTPADRCLVWHMLPHMDQTTTSFFCPGGSRKICRSSGIIDNESGR